MRLYTFYTPQHDVLYREWFLPSIRDDVDIVANEADDGLESSDFMEAGWNDIMIEKCRIILHAIDHINGDIFIYSDVDVQFFRPILPLIAPIIRDCDLLLQREKPEGLGCAGFMVVRANTRTRDLFDTVRTRIAERKIFNSDQGALNDILIYDMISTLDLKQQSLNIFRRHKMLNSISNTCGVVWNYLPLSFYSPGHERVMWEPGNVLHPPHDIAMHHANWTIGVHNKISQLRYVKSLVSQSKPRVAAAKT